jgi:hypothetical protein
MFNKLFMISIILFSVNIASAIKRDTKDLIKRDAINWVYKNCGDIEDQPYIQRASIYRSGKLTVKFDLMDYAYGSVQEHTCTFQHDGQRLLLLNGVSCTGYYGGSVCRNSIN